MLQTPLRTAVWPALPGRNNVMARIACCVALLTASLMALPAPGEEAKATAKTAVYSHHGQATNAQQVAWPGYYYYGVYYGSYRWRYQPYYTYYASPWYDYGYQYTPYAYAWPGYG